MESSTFFVSFCFSISWNQNTPLTKLDVNLNLFKHGRIKISKRILTPENDNMESLKHCVKLLSLIFILRHEFSVLL